MSDSIAVHEPVVVSSPPAASGRATIVSGLALALAAGTLLPAQFAMNGALAGELGSSTLTGAISYTVGAVFLAGLVVLQRRPLDWPEARRAPWWAWLGGVVGSAYVVGSMLLTRALGAALATTLVIAAQVVAAVALEHFGRFGLRQRVINRTRILALLLTCAALAVRLWGPR